MASSLSQRLNRRLLSVTLLFALLASAVTGWLAFNEASETQDNLLRQVARLSVLSGGSLTLNNPDGEQEDVLVWQTLVPDTGTGLRIPADADDGVQTLNLDDVDWRVYLFTAADGSRYAVSQPLAARNEIARDNSLITLVPLLLLLPLLLWLVGRAVSSGLSPVHQLGQSLDGRSATGLQRLPLTQVPSELIPFVVSINGLLERLEKHIQQQNRFIADAAHELRTPVAGLTLLADNMARGGSAVEQMAALQNGLQRLQKLVAQLLNLARLQQDEHPQPGRVDAQMMLRDVVAGLYPLAESRAVDLGVARSEGISVQALPGSLETLLRNAIDNAVRYSSAQATRTGIPAEVNISLYQDNGDLMFEVEDNGPGIPVEDIEQVFKPFYRAGNHPEPGNGLGLALIHEIAARLGGRVTLQNRTEGGLRFIYRQPAVL